MTFEEQFVKEITPILHDIAERVIREAVAQALEGMATIKPKQDRYERALRNIMDFHSPSSATHKCAKVALDEKR